MEYVPLKAARCNAVKNVTMELRFIVIQNGISEHYGIFKKNILWDLTLNESSILFNCGDDIGDEVTDIKGSCSSRFDKYKALIIKQQQTRFIIVVPTKFDYAETVYNQDYINGYAVIAGYCGFLILGGLLLIHYLTKRVSNTAAD